mmetsp:Transcript_23491/g.44633  ORF Transcript_23491/g.44633 Transcript_23491/m.44633 type:complete len:81 (-) Transcript_23491:4555-4797(-)
MRCSFDFACLDWQASGWWRWTKRWQVASQGMAKTLARRYNTWIDRPMVGADGQNVGMSTTQDTTKPNLPNLAPKVSSTGI